MKRIMKWFIVLCMILPMTRIVHAGPHTFSFTLTDGRIVTPDDYKDDVVMIVWFSAETDENGDAVNARSAKMLKTLSKDPLIDEDGLTVIAVAVEDMDPKTVDAFVDKYGRHDQILYGYNGQEELDYLYEGRDYVLTVCAIFVNGNLSGFFDYQSDNTDYDKLVRKRLYPTEYTSFDLLEKVTYYQSDARTVLDMINEFRTGDDAWCWNEDDTEKIYYTDLKPYVYDYELEKAAMQRAAEASVFFSHMRADGQSCYSTFWEVGLTQDNSYGECLAHGSNMNSEIAFTAWQESDKKYIDQGHRQIMLSDRYTACGIACCKVKNNRFWALIVSEESISADPIPADNSEHIAVIHANDEYLDKWKMENDTIVLEPGKTGSVSDFNRLVAVYVGRSVTVQNALSWTSSDTSVISVGGDSFIAHKEGTAVLTATAPDNKKTVQFNVIVGTKPEPTPPVKKIPMLRLYNPNSWEHFYTGNVKENLALFKMGWQPEGTGWIAPEKSNTPVYRLYNPNNGGDHHYTLNKKEYDALVTAGWTGEGIRWYSDDAKGVPVYREYNPGAPIRNHNYTANKKEHDYLISIGWKDEGIGWYGVK